MPAVEAKRLERSTPFITSGKLQAAAQDSDNDKFLANMKLSDLEIDETFKVGEGAYGNVYSALHKPTGI